MNLHGIALTSSKLTASLTTVRINSTQSVRIRNLESEISRLLSENIAYRERVIKLQHEVDRCPGEVALDGVATLRLTLEAKLAELGNLVQELGKAHDGMSVGRTSRRRSTQQSSPKKSPDQRNWKNALTLSEVTGGSENPRLPPIIEDKYYPRRTLEYGSIYVPTTFANLGLDLKSCLVSSTVQMPSIRQNLALHQ